MGRRASLDIPPWAGKGKRLGPLGETELPSLQRAKEQDGVLCPQRAKATLGEGKTHSGREKNPPRKREKHIQREENPSKKVDYYSRAKENKAFSPRAGC